MLNDTSLNSTSKPYQFEHIEPWQIVTSGVAHDFSNLLTSILGQSSLALLQLPEETIARNHIEKVIKAAEYATALSDQLLTYSQGNDDDLESINLNILLQDNLSLLDTTFLDGIDLEVDLSPGLPVFKGKRGQIQRVVMNLLINAAEAIYPCQGTISIATGQQKGNGSLKGDNGRSPSPDNFIYLKIKDNGTGIEPDTLNHIFEPFYTTKPKGRGLGLPAVQQILKQYKGQLDIQSELGKGTTVTVYFPAT
jgi:signal transduction histidine kinase